MLAPNGHDPIANAFAYVATMRNSFPATVACELCNQPIDTPAATTTSAADGSFTLDIGSLPVSSTIQLTVNIGRFRHTSTVTVTPCMPTVLTAAETSLPGKATAGTDDIPKIAVATGNQDQLDTVLGAMGLDQMVGFDCFEGRAKPTAGGTLKTLTTPCGKRTNLTYIEDHAQQRDHAGELQPRVPLLRARQVQVAHRDAAEPASSPTSRPGRKRAAGCSSPTTAMTTSRRRSRAR